MRTRSGVIAPFQQVALWYQTGITRRTLADVTGTPNVVLQNWRHSQRLSQSELALLLRRAGKDLGEPNRANKLLIMRWESGQVRSPGPNYQRALEHATGLPLEALGFPPRVTPDGRGGFNLAAEPDDSVQPRQQKPMAGEYSGVWLSTYEYYSSGRNATFEGQHHVVVLHYGGRLTVNSLAPRPPDQGSTLSMTLNVDRNVVSGSWREDTDPDGYYQGATYHGVIQLLVEPTGRKMAGKWLGFGRAFDVNSGPWELRKITDSVSKVTLDAYSRRPGD